jgi:hypothetical protein
MPVETTYTSLLTDLRRYLERGSVTDTIVYEQLPSLVNLAERRLARELKIEGFQVPVTSTMTSGLAVYSKPDRWRLTVSMNIGVGTDLNTFTPLLPRSYEYLRNWWTNRSETDQPQFYADYDYNHWLIAPTPAAAYPWEIIYYQLPELLDETTQTNWTTRYAPEALLYASLLESTPFLKDDARVPTWQAFYDRSMASLNGEDIKKIMDRSERREGA